jgi:hypothetical protein
MINPIGDFIKALRVEAVRKTKRIVARTLLIVIPILLVPLALVKIILDFFFEFCAEAILHKLEEIADDD